MKYIEIAIGFLKRSGVLALVPWVLMAPMSSPVSSFCSSSDLEYRAWSTFLENANPVYIPKWSSSGSYIVASLEHGVTYVVRSDGSSLKRISPGKGGYKVDFSPVISPDGSRILFATSRHRSSREVSGSWEPRNFEIETSRLDGSDRQRLTDNRDLDTAPAWSPDGERIAFVREPFSSENPGIYTMNSDGTDQRRIVPFRKKDLENGLDFDDLGHIWGPVWSPDGHMLAYMIDEKEWTRNEDGLFSDIVRRNVMYVVGADGSGLTRLFTTSDFPYDAIFGPPAWSPDSRTLAFSHWVWKGRLSRGPEDGVKLHIINRDGTGLRELPDPNRDLLGRRVTRSLEWSPDGTMLLVSLDEYMMDPAAIYFVNVDGSGIRKVAEGQYASWSPDGSKIAILNPNKPGVVLAWMPRDGGEFRDLVIEDAKGRLKAANPG